MCGICGFQSAGVNPATLARMVASLRARGPDEEGSYIGGDVALGMRRLRVIDLVGGQQPMTNEDGSIRLVFNGEIYNFRDLRAELRQRGHRFRSVSDTEVIIHGYEEWGDAVVERLDGMFAFAIWDARERSWLVARDRAGEKPLYYYHAPGLFAFASEPKALLRHPCVPRRLDAAALAAYLTFEYVPSPLSIYDGIRKLPPGHRMRVSAQRLEVERYWTFPARSDAEQVEALNGDRGWPEALRERLGRAVERCLVADVPLGCFLSGGVDSSAVAVLMQERLGPRRLQTFSLGFNDPSFDESVHAERVARHLGTEHHVQVLRAQDLFDLIPCAAGFMDEPLGDGSLLPTLALARFARAHVTVALTGDGGDELFGGYPTLWADRWAEHYRRFVPDALHRFITATADRIPVSASDMSLDFRIKQFLRAARMPAEERHFGWVGSFHPPELASLLRHEVRDAALATSPYDRITDELAQGPRREGLDRLLFLYARFYLAEDILAKVDRCTMSCGLETRAPLLDPEFMRFAAALPNRLKVHGSGTKIALRQAFADALPPSILARPKKGFGMPVSRWMRGPLRGLMLDLLSSDRLQRQGLFESAPVERMWREHLERRADRRKPLWTLLAFQLWYCQHMEEV